MSSTRSATRPVVVHGPGPLFGAQVQVSSVSGFQYRGFQGQDEFRLNGSAVPLSDVARGMLFMTTWRNRGLVIIWLLYYVRC